MDPMHIPELTARLQNPQVQYSLGSTPKLDPSPLSKCGHSLGPIHCDTHTRGIFPKRILIFNNTLTLVTMTIKIQIRKIQKILTIRTHDEAPPVLQWLFLIIMALLLWLFLTGQRLLVRLWLCYDTVKVTVVWWERETEKWEMMLLKCNHKWYNCTVCMTHNDAQ